MKAAPLVLAILALAAGAGGYYFLQRHPQAPGGDVFQGYVDGDLLQAGPEVSGRITELSVQEGARVQTGEIIIRLDDRLQQTGLELAAARLEEARARLRLAEAQRQRPEALRVLEAAVEQVKAALKVSRAEYERIRRLYEKHIVPKARLDTARGALERDEARLEEAKRQLETARLPARAEEIGAAMASVRAAEAQVREAKARLQQTRVQAPAGGVVQEVYFRPGEIVRAGQPVLSILPPRNLKIRFYVAEPLRAKYHLGDIVEISCDSCSGNQRARISFISGKAEYTPPVIFSPRERARLVYRLEAVPLSKAFKLAIGQPVDVRPAGGGKAGK